MENQLRVMSSQGKSSAMASPAAMGSTGPGNDGCATKIRLQ